MERFALVLVIAVAAAGVAWLLGRRRTDAPAEIANIALPTHLERSDFARPDAPWLVTVFTSPTCQSCADAWTKASVLACDDVAVDEVSYDDRSDLHDRYHVDSVPIVVVADRTGTVRTGFAGPPGATDLWAAVAELREPGSVPPGCHAPWRSNEPS